MMPPVVSWMNASPDVVSLLKPASVMRVFRDEIPETEPKPSSGPAAAVYRLIAGTPHHKLDCAPSIDSLRLQFDVYANTRSDADNVFVAVRDALELHGYVTYNFTDRDIETRNWRVSFDFTCWQRR
jgi:hypothetical protein